MKKIVLPIATCLILVAAKTQAQNIFPASGRAGVYTTSPAASLQVNGGARIGTTTNYVNVDSATGNLSFGGNGQYRVGGNKYAFAFSGNPNYGLYFNQTNLRYEFRNGSASPIFYVGANDGTASFSGDVVINGITVGKGAGTGLYNTALGIQALFKNTGGIFNTAVGGFTLFNNTTGTGNAGSGYATLYTNTTGSYNTATGYEALYFNTASYNTASGYASMFYHRTGNYNTAVGFGSLQSDTSGFDNTAIGFNAMILNSSGAANTAVGSHALESNQTGVNNTFVGFKADVNDVAYNNSTALGYTATITASNQVRIGNADVTSIGGQVGWTTLSDGRVKKNIKENIPGLAFINKLKPVSYNLNEDAVDNIIQRPEIKNADGKKTQPSAEALAARKEKEKIVYTGFIAQDVEKAAKELSYDFSGVDAPKNNKDLYGLRYSDFVAPLVKAVQELSAQNEELKKRLDAMEQLISQNGTASAATTNNTTVMLSAAHLEQNAPNPFNRQTTINYYIPQTSGNAVLKVTNMSGAVIKMVSLSAKGNGQVTIQADQLASGTYQYTLLIDGRVVDTKKMIITK